MDPVENRNSHVEDEKNEPCENGTPVSGEATYDVSEYEKDGWVVGYAVEVNGVGRTTVNPDDSSSSDGFISDTDTEDDVTNDENDKKGYLLLSAEPVEEPVVRNCEQNGLSQTNGTPAIVHQSNDIQLDSERISQIKSAMQGFQLPPMSSMPDDSKLLDLLKGLNTGNL